MSAETILVISHVKTKGLFLNSLGSPMIAKTKMSVSNWKMNSCPLEGMGWTGRFHTPPSPALDIRSCTSPEGCDQSGRYELHPHNNGPLYSRQVHHSRSVRRWLHTNAEGEPELLRSRPRKFSFSYRPELSFRLETHYSSCAVKYFRSHCFRAFQGSAKEGFSCSPN